MTAKNHKSPWGNKQSSRHTTNLNSEKIISACVKNIVLATGQTQTREKNHIHYRKCTSQTYLAQDKRQLGKRITSSVKTYFAQDKPKLGRRIISSVEMYLAQDKRQLGKRNHIRCKNVLCTGQTRTGKKDHILCRNVPGTGQTPTRKSEATAWQGH